MRKPKSSSGADSRTRPRQEAETGRIGSGQRVAAGLSSGYTRHDLLIGLALLALCLCVYWPVHRFDFVVYDDTEYVVENVRVQAGLTGPNIAWAFQTFFFDNWHPITWLSYMFDSQLFGPKPGVFHLVNLLFHGLNSVLVFGVLKKLTGVRWPSAFVAAFFAVHPLHVESVAWISERKDLLSAFFGLLVLWAYARSQRSEVRSQKSVMVSGYYWLAVVFFALGLMAKPMLVTWPFVLLLLDVWPLGRLKFEAGSFKVFTRLVAEKIPFFVLTAVSSLLTFQAQTEALMPTSFRPLPVRVMNAVVGYGRYLGKMVWPDQLAVYYPYPARWSAGLVFGSAAVLVAVTVLALVSWKRRPCLLIGWCWFLGTLVPVIGLVQVGGQSMADRYMYLPMIGLLLMLVFGARDLARRVGPGFVRALPIIGVVLLMPCLVLGARQVRHWENSVTLFEHAVAATGGSTLAHDNLSVALVGLGRTNEALDHVAASLALEPADFWAYGNRGTILLGQGKIEEGMASFEQGLKLNPDRAELNHNLAIGLSMQKKHAEALPYFSAALRARPDYAAAHLGLGNALVELGRAEEAAASYNAVLRLNPKMAAAHYNLGHALKEQGKLGEAAAHFSQTLSLQPTNADAHCELALALAGQGKNQDAYTHFTEAVRLNPNKGEFHFQLASFLYAQHRAGDAVVQFREAVRLEPAFVPALNNLAFILAAHDDARIRNGAEAVQLAERACELTGRRQSSILATLAAAYAETGQFPKAIEVAQQAIDLAQASGEKELTVSHQKLLEIYRSGQPYRLGNN